MAYHGVNCQRAHWRAGHRKQCQPIETRSLDWAAEAAAAWAGLAAWEQAGEGQELAAALQRLHVAQMEALVQQREAMGLPAYIGGTSEDACVPDERAGRRACAAGAPAGGAGAGSRARRAPAHVTDGQWPRPHPAGAWMAHGRNVPMTPGSCPMQ